MVIISQETREATGADLLPGIDETLGHVQGMVATAERYGLPQTAHEFRVAIVALRRAITKAQAQA